ncbi:TPA: hypothetical protein ACK4TW_001260 [Neisseria gonorrhoeae]|nr:hypothetical protein [Neisseria gonorrhoeae]
MQIEQGLLPMPSEKPFQTAFCFAVRGAYNRRVLSGRKPEG